MSKKYKLLRDLPDCKAGAIYHQTGDSREYVCYTNIEIPGTWSVCYNSKYVENNPDWFEEVKEIAIGTIVEDVRTGNVLAKAPRSSFHKCPDGNWRPYNFVQSGYAVPAEQFEKKIGTIFELVNSVPPKPKPEEVKQKDWEILTVFNETVGRVLFSGFYQSTLEEVLAKFKILSVKRSDGEVFTIGDEVRVKQKDEPKDWWGKITEFWITGNGDMHICYNGHHYDINNFKKRKDASPQPKQKERIEADTNKCVVIGNRITIRFKSNLPSRTDEKLIEIAKSAEKILNDDCNISLHCEAIPDAALEELWGLIDLIKNKFLDIKAKCKN